VAAGDYTLIVSIGSVPAAYGGRTFTGVNAEVATTTPEIVALKSATQLQIDDIEVDAAASVGYLTTLVSRVTSGVASMWADLVTMIIGDGTANAQWSTKALELAPAGGGGGGGGDATLANQVLILDAIDNYISSTIASVNGTTGMLIGFPTSLHIGDSYTDSSDSSIHVFIRDANDAPITDVGDFAFTDATFAPIVVITQSGTVSRVRASVTYVDPGAAESYLKVQIPSGETRRAAPGIATIQCILRWVDADDKVLCQKTISSQAVTWVEMI
jgi:hypothetical protein